MEGSTEPRLRSNVAHGVGFPDAVPADHFRMLRFPMWPAPDFAPLKRTRLFESMMLAVRRTLLPSNLYFWLAGQSSSTVGTSNFRR